MGNESSTPAGHYRAGPQYQAPPTHFNRGYTMRETQHFKGGYTLRDSPKKKKMGLVGVPEYSPPQHVSQPAIAAAQAAWTAPPAKHSKQRHSHRATAAYSPPQTFSQPSVVAAPTEWMPPAPKQHFKHGYSLRNNHDVSSFSNPKSSRFGSREAQQQACSQPASQSFSHGHSYSTFHDVPPYKPGNCRKRPPYQDSYKPSHFETVLPPLPKGHCKKRPPVQDPYKPSHFERVLPPLPEGHCKKRPPVQLPWPENRKKKSFWS
ncbi:hypothetical protein F52700_558 [Fusarium sp. NRRL 52700]|nr:hypothetical protein F52700_558 [Fusarium sp. NRRL 52700]